MASLSSAAARSTAAGGHATAMQRCFVPRLPRRGITAQTARSASGPQRKAAQHSDSSVRSPVVVASSNQGSQAAREAGPAPAVRVAQPAPFWRLAALLLLVLLACWLLPTMQSWSANSALLLAQLAGMFVLVVYTKKMQALNDQDYVEFLLRRKQPAELTAELARKFRGLRGDVKLNVFLLLLVGLAVTAALVVADVLSRVLAGHGIARYLLQPVLTLSHPAGPDWSLPLWFALALPFLSIAGIPAEKAYEACRERRLYWAAVAARRQAHTARLNAKRSGAQQPSTQP